MVVRLDVCGAVWIGLTKVMGKGNPPNFLTKVINWKKTNQGWWKYIEGQWR